MLYVYGVADIFVICQFEFGVSADPLTIFS